MKTVGIIAEYNPFHKGHQYQLQYAKEVLNADYIIIAMSGDYVQRGTPAVFPKHVRAKMALQGGADLILELPVSVSTASAEFFAAGGINLFNQLGIIDTLCFGCENNDLSLFTETAKILAEEPEDYRKELQKELKCGKTFPAARSLALLKYFSNSCFNDFSENKSYIKDHYSEDAFQLFFSSPNNILGIEYCKALLRQNSAISPHPLKREGADYHNLTLNAKNFPSASGIRHFISSTSKCKYADIHSMEYLTFIKNSLQPMIPEAPLNTFLDCLSRNGAVSEHHLDLLLHYRLLEETIESLTQYPDVSEELARRIINTRNQYQSFIQFTELLKTKELTYTRIQRALLHILLKIKTITSSVPYARVLGFRKTASPILKEIKRNSSIPLITKLADAEKILDSKGLQLLQENTFASNLYETLIQHQSCQHFHHEYTKPVIIV